MNLPNLTREEIGTICFCIFGLVWAYTAHTMFPYPHDKDEDDWE